MAIARILLIPLLLLSNAQPRSNLPVLIKNDIIYGIIVATTGFTNGYVTTLSMMYGPK